MTPARLTSAVSCIAIELAHPAAEQPLRPEHQDQQEQDEPDDLAVRRARMKTETCSATPSSRPAANAPKMLPRPASTTTTSALSVQAIPMAGAMLYRMLTSVPATPASAAPSANVIR